MQERIKAKAVELLESGACSRVLGWKAGEFFYADAVDLPEPSEEEARYQALWRKFYDTIAVEGRVNPKLRRGMMPMRYWKNMTEFQR